MQAASFCASSHILLGDELQCQHVWPSTTTTEKTRAIAAPSLPSRGQAEVGLTIIVRDLSVGTDHRTSDGYVRTLAQGMSPGQQTGEPQRGQAGQRAPARAARIAAQAADWAAGAGHPCAADALLPPAAAAAWPAGGLMLSCPQQALHTQPLCSVRCSDVSCQHHILLHPSC